MLAEKLAAKGRMGDTEVSHTTKGEIVIPLNVQQADPALMQMVEAAFAKAGVDMGRYVVGGGDDSINPATGMREYAGSFSSGDSSRGDADAQSRDAAGAAASNGGGDNGGYNFTFGETAPEGFYNSPGYDANGEGAYSPGREIGGGMVSFMGVSPAERASMIGPRETQYGLGFNPGAALGSLGGSLLGGPIGGMAGSLLGRQMSDTRFGAWGQQGQQQQQDPREGGNTLAEMLMGRR